MSGTVWVRACFGPIIETNGNLPTFNTADPRTTCVWVYLYSTAQTRGIASPPTPLGITGSWFINNANSLAIGGVFSFHNAMTPADVDFTNANTIALNRWYCLVGIASNNTVKLYVDGANNLTTLTDSSDANHGSVTETYVIGKDPLDRAYFHGKIDESVK